MKLIIGAIVLTIALVGCQTTGQKITRLGSDTSREQVVQLLGRPDSMRVVAEFEIYTYLQRHQKRRSIRNTDYTVILKDGQVIQYGPGLARRAGLHNMVIVSPE